jgi:hypothetical protein
LVKKTLHRHRAGFQPQRPSPFRKRIKPPKYSEKPPEPERSFLSVLLFHTACGVGEPYQRRSVIVTLCRPPPHQDSGRARTAGDRFARDEKELEPQLRKIITHRTATLNRRDVTYELLAQPACPEERRRSA